MSINFNGKSIKLIAHDLLEMSQDWKEVKPTKDNVNDFGLQVFAEFLSAFNLEVEVKMRNKKKDKIK